MKFIHQPASSDRLGEFLQVNFKRSWPIFRASVAFVKRSGTRHILSSLTEFSKKQRCEWLVGIDHRGTSKEGLEDLLTGVGASGRVVVFHNPIASTFHPKLYLFRSDKEAELLVGSGNLTEGGLFTNYEASIQLSLKAQNKQDLEILNSIEAVLDEWFDTSKGTARELDRDFLDKLVGRGYVPLEALSAPERDGEEGGARAKAEGAENKGETDPLFSARGVHRAPAVARKQDVRKSRSSRTTTSTTAPETGSGEVSKGYVMTLQRTDVGVGQVTSGASKRSPEIFIPLSARDVDPIFWGWPDKFTEDPTKPGKFDRQGVRIRIGAEICSVNMMTWPDKHDFRLRSEALRSAGNIDDILRIERVDSAIGFDYFAVVIPPGASEFGIYQALCKNTVRNSKKRYGYY
jgi:HKD family nuclease